jgi:two-component system chemotaxis response regulator CheB
MTIEGGENLPQPFRRDHIVIGGSQGSLAPLLQILSGLPATLRAAVFIVQHRMPSSRDSLSVLASSCALPVMLARDRAPVRQGVVYFGPPDLHLLLSDGAMRVVRGPRENLARPSIDVLFRSSAVDFGPRTIGVILSGALNDGAGGLSAILRCGGYGIVQAPHEAVDDEMPRAALELAPQHALPVAEIAGALARLSEELAPPAPPVPNDLAIEARAAAVAMTDPTPIDATADPAHLTCPECDGPLFRVHPAKPEQYRCDIGHAFSPEALSQAQSNALERALWVAFRTLLERARLLEQLANSSERRGMSASAESYRKRMEELKEHSSAVLAALSAVEGDSRVAGVREVD